MGEVVNLRLARKQRARAAASVRADENRRLFGRNAAQKAIDTAERSRLTRTLDGARRNDEPSEPTLE
jgi:hypothetical protein